ncbi:MAG TPA: hypothetical protein VIJ47_01335, partial [Acidimicrobiales bacterium]
MRYGRQGKRAVMAAMAVLAATVTMVSVGGGPAAAADGTCATVAGVVTCTFAYNGTDGTDGTTQTWLVPAGVTQILVTADGAQGGGPTGGLGGEARSSVAVIPGETLWVNVGGDPIPVAVEPPAPGGF